MTPTVESLARVVLEWLPTIALIALGSWWIWETTPSDEKERLKGKLASYRPAIIVLTLAVIVFAAWYYWPAPVAWTQVTKEAGKPEGTATPETASKSPTAFLRNSPTGTIEGTKIDCNTVDGASNFIDNEGRITGSEMRHNSTNGQKDLSPECNNKGLVKDAQKLNK